LERALRLVCLKHWFTLYDEGLEDAFYDSQAFRAFLELELARQAERLKAQLRARVERSVYVVENLFAHRKTRYPRLKKNANQLRLLFAWASLYLWRRALAA
jgi:IS5 family transposase